MIDDVTLFALLDEHAPWRPVPLVPRLSTWSAPDELALWQALEASHSAGHAQSEAGATSQASVSEGGVKLDPPFFAVAWPAAQALAKALLDEIVDVKGRVVADVGCGSGLASAAAKLAGAKRVIAIDIDELAVRAAVELGRRHGVDVEGIAIDALANPSELIARGVDVVIAGDVVYGERQRDLFANALNVWRAARREIIVADSGRPFFDTTALGLADADVVMRVDVATPRSLDGATSRRVAVYRARAT